MESQIQNKPEAPKATDAPAAPSQALQEALNTYSVCKDGTVVSNPKDCLGNNVLPTMSLDNISKA
jgi:hypothetical protein